MEVVSENIGVLVGALGATDLTGYSCTRVYVTMQHEDDFLSSVSGDAVNPTYVNTTTNFYHAALGTATPNGINGLLFPVYPDLAYDSWVTIGLDSLPNTGIGESHVGTSESTDQPWTTTFDPGGGLPGGNIVMNDDPGSAWFALCGDANGVAGEDLKVLAGQFTTTGVLSCQLYVQVFIHGECGDEYLGSFELPAPNLGCLDADACNYDPLAYEDDGSCEYPMPGFDCDCNFLNGADGVCFVGPDGCECIPEEPGCTDSIACNYNPAATDDNGSCIYPVTYYDCNGDCLNDSDGDGICNELEVLGCMEEAACNYNPLATDDDASCEYPALPGIVDCDCNCIVEPNDSSTPCSGLVCFVGPDGCECIPEVPGCMDSGACNYNPAATDDNGSCQYWDECGVCGGAGIPAGQCDCDGNVVDALGDCGGDCASDEDGDGVCDTDEVEGCQDEGACNFNLAATDSAQCFFPVVVSGVVVVDCDGHFTSEAAQVLCGPGTYWNSELSTCLTLPECPSDVDGDGAVGVNDLLMLLADFQTTCD